MKDDGALSAQPMSIISRPTEYGIDEIGEAAGDANTSTVFWFITSGDSEETSFSIFGNKSGDPLENTAAYRAATGKGGDAFYETAANVTTTSTFFGFYKTKTIHVTGKALKLKHIGTLTEERADRLRAMAAGAYKAK